MTKRKTSHEIALGVAMRIAAPNDEHLQARGWNAAGHVLHKEPFDYDEAMLQAVNAAAPDDRIKRAKSVTAYFKKIAKLRAIEQGKLEKAKKAKRVTRENNLVVFVIFALAFVVYWLIFSKVFHFWPC
jgi:hypothetical protein